ncbi:hypothetical protein [Flexistipes sp.]|uniref:hypothetical protein n=1 Tax=Flexistipes sp. TaxID=3088135 RepID=UPI002E1C1FFC|nr:hypothetical protein [Flexistipes sp.]
MYTFEEWSELIDIDPEIIIEAPYNVKNNKGIIEQVIYEKPQLFKYASQRLKNIDDLVMFAVEEYPANIFEANSKFLRNTKVLHSALSNQFSLLPQILEKTNIAEWSQDRFPCITIKINNRDIHKHLQVVLSELKIFISDDFMESGILVIEKDNDKVQFLKKHLPKSSGKKLKIYTVEMFLASLIGETDIYDFGQKYLDCCVKDSIAFELIFKMKFKWPSINIDDESKEKDYNPSEESLLSLNGYHVGKNGVPFEKRKEILKKTYNMVAPEEFHFWGQPKSSKRLYWMAKTISECIKKAKGKVRKNQGDFSVSIEDWTNDRAWLKKTYYDTNRSFRFDDEDIW